MLSEQCVALSQWIKLAVSKTYNLGNVLCKNTEKNRNQRTYKPLKMFFQHFECAVAMNHHLFHHCDSWLAADDSCAGSDWFIAWEMTTPFVDTEIVNSFQAVSPMKFPFQVSFQGPSAPWGIFGGRTSKFRAEISLAWTSRFAVNKETLPRSPLDNDFGPQRKPFWTIQDWGQNGSHLVGA